MKYLKLMLLSILAIAAGCTSQAGPFVTNISSDGRGGLVVEKCMISLQRQLATVENSGCVETNITLSGSAARIGQR